MKLSIIIPVYNCAPYIEQALQSVFREAPEGTEVIVVEDGSADGSREIAGRAGAAWGGSFRVLTHPGGRNKGPGASRNLGVQAASGEWIAFLDGDDYYLPGRFDADFRMLADDPLLDGMIGVTRIDFGEGSKERASSCDEYLSLPAGISGEDLLQNLMERKFWHVNALTVRRSAILAAGGFAEHLRMSEDCLLWFKLAAVARVRVSREPFPVAVYRRRPGSTLCIGPESQGCLLQAMAEAWRWTEKQPISVPARTLLKQGAADYFMNIAGTAYVQKKHQEAYGFLRRLIRASGLRLLLEPKAAWLAGRIVLAELRRRRLAAAILRRIGRFLFSAIFDRPPNEPDENEKAALIELHAAFSRLPQMECNQCLPTESAWRENMNRVRDLVLHDNPREFLRWSVISNSMFIASAEYLRDELKVLKSQTDWRSRWRPAIREGRVGRPAPCTFYPSSSGNLIHHAYHLAVFEKKTGIPVQEIDVVVEFGGGYGSMCRLFHNAGFRGRYVIFDLPHFSLLQRYYLKTLGLSVLDNDSAERGTGGIACLSEIGQFRRMMCELPSGTRKMFVATWSISEVPIVLREEFLSMVSDFQTFLIAYQERFGEADNVEYFEKWIASVRGLRWERQKISHLPADWYLIGSRSPLQADPAGGGDELDERGNRIVRV